MTNFHRFGFRSMGAALVLLPAFLLAGCGGYSAPTQFYTLASTIEPSGAAKPAEKRLSIGVGPVILAEYLDRPQIVVRGSPYKVALADFDQWAAPLDTALPTVIVGNLAALLPQDNVVMVPQPYPLTLDYQIRLNINRFDIDTGGNAVTEAQWQIFDVKKSTVVATQNSVLREAAGTGGTEAGVAALSRTLGALSREMAKAVATVSGTASAGKL